MAAPKRFFTQNIAEEVTLMGEEYRHAKNVLRLCEGDEVSLLDGSGKEYTAIISRVSKGEMILHVTGEKLSDREPKADVTVLIGALKGDKTELVVQKAAELGVKKVVVFSSRYCAAYMNENKLERLNRVSREAAKQCLRATAPEVVYCDTLREAFCTVKDCKTKLFACEFATESEKDPLSAESPCALVVGSEGGFTQEEFALAKENGFAGVTLGKRILRAETAAIAFLSVVMFGLGELR